MTEVGQPATTESPKPEAPALIVGLGNPGAEYAAHRHNIGFRVVETLARAYGMTFTRQKALRAHVAEGRVHSSSVLLAKPRTFMNRGSVMSLHATLAIF